MLTRSRSCAIFCSKERRDEEIRPVVFYRIKRCRTVHARLRSLEGLPAVRRKHGHCRVLAARLEGRVARHTSLGLNFVGVNYYDGQGFMVPKKANVKSAKQLNGATVCVQPGTTTELNLADYFRANRMSFKPVVIEKLEEVLNAYFAGRCDVFTTDQSGLVALRASRATKPEDHVILPEIVSKEPLGPAVRHGDDRWFDIVKWSLFAMLEAEELGLSSKNIDGEAKSN